MPVILGMWVVPGNCFRCQNESLCLCHAGGRWVLETGSRRLLWRAVAGTLLSLHLCQWPALVLSQNIPDILPFFSQRMHRAKGSWLVSTQSCSNIWNHYLRPHSVFWGAHGVLYSVVKVVGHLPPLYARGRPCSHGASSLVGRACGVIQAGDWWGRSGCT